MRKSKNEGFVADNQRETKSDAQVNETSSDQLVDDQNIDTSAKMADSTVENQIDQIDWQDRYMRLSAEFDNFRKRTLREKMDLIDNAGADVLLAMLSTADDFDRALAHISDSTVREGVELIYHKFLAALRSKGVIAMELIGQPFNVDFAEAIAKFDAPSDDLRGTVMDVAQKGYMLKEKVLRFAKVVVYQ